LLSSELDKLTELAYVLLVAESAHALSTAESAVAQLEPDRAKAASTAYEAVSKNTDEHGGGASVPAIAASFWRVGGSICTGGAGGSRAAPACNVTPSAAIIFLCSFLAYAREASTCPDFRGMMGTNWLSRCWISCAARWMAQRRQREQPTGSFRQAPPAGGTGKQCRRCGRFTSPRTPCA